VIIHSAGGGEVGEEKVASVELLGSSGSLSFQQSPDGLKIHLPDNASGKYAYVFQIRFGH